MCHCTTEKEQQTGQQTGPEVRAFAHVSSLHYQRNTV
jgi:hypothetical protein